MKIDDELVLVQRKDGTWYFRGNRSDNLDPRRRSPALKYVQGEFGRAQRTARGKKGLVNYKGTLVPPGAAEAGRSLSALGQAPARHFDQKEARRREGNH